MKLSRWLIGGALALGLGLGYAIAQTVVTTTLVGTEFFNGQAGSVGGGGIVVPTYVLRNASNHQLVATGTTVTTQVLPINKVVIATGAITTWNINLPLTPYAGEEVLINCPGGTASTIVLTATKPTSVAIVGTALTSCTSGGTGQYAAAFQYSLGANTWYRIL